MPFKVVAQHDQQTWQVAVAVAGPTLLELLQQHQVPIKSSCLGKGLCRQCRVRVVSGLAPVSATDRKSFSEDLLQQGWRLSCGLRPKTAMVVEFPQIFVFQEQFKKDRQPLGPWEFVCDFGTTGIELAAVDKTGVWAKIKALNRQVSMGADVMTRLECAQRLGVEPLFSRANEQLKKLTQWFFDDVSRPIFKNRIWLAGNSAVTAFVAQESIDTLAVAPYQPSRRSALEFTIAGLEAHSLPLLSSFVGGDLFAGLFLLWQRDLISEEPWVLMDVGTNSEILFWDGDVLYVSSTPAGPAFEGSSISIGMRAETGAVVQPKYDLETQTWRYEVIGQDIPKGICGTGLIEMISDAVKNGLIANDGEVLKPRALFLTDQLALSQDDVREFQLAKSAIQTGLEIVQSASSRPPQRLYLAGAFGENLNLEACRHLGLLPNLQTETLGNSSLHGAILWSQARAEQKLTFTNWLEKKMQPLELALSDRFQQAFVRNMSL